jgi:hypothetical protein
MSRPTAPEEQLDYVCREMGHFQDRIDTLNDLVRFYTEIMDCATFLTSGLENDELCNVNFLYPEENHNRTINITYGSAKFAIQGHMNALLQRASSLENLLVETRTL